MVLERRKWETTDVRCSIVRRDVDVWTTVGTVQVVAGGDCRSGLPGPLSGRVMFDIAAKLCGRILVLSDVTLASVLRVSVPRCSSDLDGDGLEVVWLSPFDGIIGAWYWYSPLLSGQVVHSVVDRRRQLDVILASAFRVSVPRRLCDVDGEELEVGRLPLLNEVIWLVLPCSGRIVTCFADNRHQQVLTCLDVTVVLAQR